MLRAPRDKEPASRIASRREIFPGPTLECSAKSILNRTTGPPIKVPPQDMIAKASFLQVTLQAARLRRDLYLLARPQSGLCALRRGRAIYMVEYNEILRAMDASISRRNLTVEKSVPTLVLMSAS